MSTIPYAAVEGNLTLAQLQAATLVIDRWCGVETLHLRNAEWTLMIQQDPLTLRWWAIAPEPVAVSSLSVAGIVITDWKQPQADGVIFGPTFLPLARTCEVSGWAGTGHVEDVAATIPALTEDATTWALPTSTGIAAGHVLVSGSERMLVTATSDSGTTRTCTLTRAVMDTEADEHDAQTAIGILRAPEDIAIACRTIARRLARLSARPAEAPADAESTPYLLSNLTRILENYRR